MGMGFRSSIVVHVLPIGERPQRQVTQQIACDPILVLFEPDRHHGAMMLVLGCLSFFTFARALKSPYRNFSATLSHCNVSA